MNYKEALDRSLRAINKEKGAKLDHKTYIRNVGDAVIIRFYDTDIVIIKPDNTYELYNGGYFSPTTKARINDYTPTSVRQKNFKWFIDDIEFFDGIQIDCTGQVLNKKNDSTEINKRAELIKKIDIYAKGLSNVLDKLPEPSAGDCWYCCGLIPTDDANHLIEHIEESYFMLRVYYNALLDHGFVYPALFKEDKQKCYSVVKRYLIKMLCK